MRAALLVIAGLALIGFIAVSFVLPQMAGSEAKEAAQTLVAGAEPAKESVAGLHQPRQDDEEVAGDECSDERVARLAEDIPGSNGGKRGDQTGEHPQTDHQGDRDVRDEIDLQPAQLLQAKCSRRGGCDVAGHHT